MQGRFCLVCERYTVVKQRCTRCGAYEEDFFFSLPDVLHAQSPPPLLPSSDAITTTTHCTHDHEHHIGSVVNGAHRPSSSRAAFSNNSNGSINGSSTCT
ncbi:hypothetical protein PTSG_12539 [Salpingoeca rosetta]|uniref:Uncharacterized protein n=1 Tax=Salpingoeca rosetta (strain ATCC 50818 / BSB-021) TaxID=946362 RepID=F2UE81_SALR5|nr:uncharacterized protein PTSG_12539 [Salpingoeca rosetta]EGD74931.1 hypothetical protein PTSG_12539 [Salpingoeca rosetta]|eukprot:XP_004992576.1 hypothetical protein PTSG_12539 [Salpingoeca rosetta]